eukprot:gene12069-14121_t
MCNTKCFDTNSCGLSVPYDTCDIPSSTPPPTTTSPTPTVIPESTNRLKSCNPWLLNITLPHESAHPPMLILSINIFSQKGELPMVGCFFIRPLEHLVYDLILRAL